MKKFKITTYGSATCFVSRTYEVEAEDVEKAKTILMAYYGMSEIKKRDI